MALTPFDPSSPPSPSALQHASKLLIKAASGKDVSFGSLYQDKKMIIIFIRHFYCGLCQSYVEHLSARITPEMLKEAGVGLAIIGCGDWRMINSYKQLIGTQFEIYADPTKKTYVTLGMTLRTLDSGKSLPAYLKNSRFASTASAIINAFKMGKIGKSSGDIKQLGGEFILGPGDESIFTHRMKTTTGHCSTKVLMEAAGVPYTGDDEEDGETAP